ncbi:right-handed parallel beta-helix repeat-containing protein [Streptomyces sp. NPDC059578]|uniref:right-handed parallel beta-helix repeat-containing protein n=1 Tax=Streptomyces sp. NPDC059578 TaxID=3346874 RepID=UPI0036B1EA59
MLYTFGGTPSDVLTTPTGDVVPNYLIIVRRAGTGEQITALLEADGVTPISELRSNPAGSGQPGAIRPFRIDGIAEIEYEYLDTTGAPVRWYQAARELPAQARAAGEGALPRTGGTVTGPLTATAGVDIAGGLQVAGGAILDELAVAGPLSVGGTFAPARLDLSSLKMFTPQAFGATGTGTGADGTAVQAALSAAAGAGGGWVIVPAGNYLGETLPLRIYRNTRLTLMPGARLPRGANGTMLINGDADQNYPGYTGHGNIIVEGGVWDMRATAPGLTASRMCMSFGHAEGITVRDVTILDVPGYHAIEVNACRNVRIENSRFMGFTNPGGRDLSEAVQIDLASDSGAFGGFGPYDSTACEDVEMRGCYVGPSGTPGTTAWPRGIGTHNARIGRWQKDIRILGNTFDQCIQYAVGGYNWEDVVVGGNTMRGCGAGIRMRAVDSTSTNHTKTPAGVQTGASQPMRTISVMGNTIADCTGHDDSIVVEGEATGQVLAVSIDGNAIDGASDLENGIRLIHVADYTVDGNTIAGVDGSGVSQQDCVGGTVTDCRITAPNGSGITANACTRVKISENNISGAGVQGVWVVGGSLVSVEDNVITSPSRAGAGAGYGIRASSGATDLRIVGNTVRRHGSGNEMGYALSITSACSGIRRWGNDWATGTLGTVDDQSPSPITSPYDVTSALTARPTLATAANSTAETAVASWTVPANDALAGTAYRVTAQGIASTTGTPTLTLRVRLGGVAGPVIAAFSAVTTSSGIASRGWRIDGTLHSLTIGGSATWAGGATLTHHLASTTGQAQTELTDAAITRDSTVDQVLVVTAQWSAASASNTAGGTAGLLQRITA